jgi:hypothetical protein
MRSQIAEGANQKSGGETAAISQRVEDNAFHLVNLRLDQRRRYVFGYSSVESTAKFAVARTVRKINQ